MILVPAGRVTVAPLDLAALSTRPPLGSSDLEALEFRRSVLWNALLAEPDVFASDVEGNETLVEVARHLQQISAGVNRVEMLPLDGDEIDAELTEALVRSSVALPLGHEVGARLQVRIIDRSGQNDLEAAAENLGRALSLIHISEPTRPY